MIGVTRDGHVMTLEMQRAERRNALNGALVDGLREAIEKEHPGGKIDKLEKITKGGKISYEALISGKAKREEIKFDSKGKVLEREDKTGKKKDD